jgi:phenylpyruvate tautomerase PptA (4-oxalocrotonate tautomerase family)
MPSVAVTMIKGYSEEAKERLCTVLTGAVRQVVPADPDAIIITLHELPAANYMRGGQHRQPASALPDATQLVRQFLTLMEARNLNAASAMLSDTFAMTFPGGVTMHSLDELVAWAKPRYQFVRKTYERFDTASGDEGPTVYCYGTLSGEWLDGTAFEGIRFIDRFETAGGKLTRQDVWNDMGEVKNG